MLYPNGWLIRMKQYLRRPFTQYDVYEQRFEQLRGGMALYISYGNFDRIEFLPITEFSGYRSYSAEDNLWYGKRQSLILYAISDKHRLFQTDSVNEPDVQWLKEGRPGEAPQPAKGRFLIYTMLHISGAAKSTVRDYHRFLELIQEKIHQVVDLYCGKRENQDEHLACEVFGTFNAAEVAVLWSADQFTDVLFLLDELRHLRFRFPNAAGPRKIFVSTYTVIAANSPNVHSTAPKGVAMVQFECSAHGGSFQNTSNFIRKTIDSAISASAPSKGGSETPAWQLYSCAGEYDYIAEIPFSLLPSLFPDCDTDKTANFSMHNQEFARYIRQTTTRLSYIESDVDQSCKDLDWENILYITLADKDMPDQAYDTSHLVAADYIDCETGSAYKLYSEICRKLEDLIPYSGMEKTLKLLYNDYAEVLCTAVDHLWVKDFNEQFIAALHIIKSLLGWWERPGRHKTQDIDSFTGHFQSISEILQQQVHHISESSKLFFEVPNSKLGYTAQFDLVLHAYYGIVKELIEHAYKTERESWQYTLIPVINFTNTMLIRSRMLRTVDDNRESARLISLNFPYDAWSSPMYYTPFLFHELYHYVAPTDRKERNTSFMVIVLHQICIAWLDMAAAGFLLKRDGVDRDDISDTQFDERYSDRIVELVDVLYIPVFQAICGKRDTLLKEVFDQTKFSSDDTAYEFRNAVERWVSDPMLHPGKMKLMQDLICEAVKSVPEPAEDEVRAYLKAMAEDDLYRMPPRRFKRECKRGFLDVALGAVFNLREIYPDIAMIRGTSMGLTEYLLQFAMLQINLLNEPPAIGGWRSLSLRLGPIMQYLLSDAATAEERSEKLNTCLEEFRRMFPVFLRCSTGDGGKSGDKKIKELVTSWISFFKKVDKYYQLNLSIYDQECAFQIEKQYRFNDSPEMEPIRRLYREYWRLLRGCQPEEDISKQIFKINLRLIHLYQNQHSLRELSETNTRTQKSDPAHFHATESYTVMGRPPHNVLSVLDNCDDLLLLLRKMVRQLKDAHESVFGETIDSNGIWYRGISNSEYHILPSLFVGYPEDAQLVKKPDSTTLSKAPYELLLHRFQQFKFRADGAPELYNQSGYQASDYFALMQHYQIRTHMLDWSEDIFASLYFALEKYVQFKDPKQWTDNPDASAAVYLFDPAAYNRVRNLIIRSCLPCLQEGKSCGDGCDEGNCKAFRKYITQTVDSASEIVPNVSIGLNRDIFDVLFCEKRVELPLSKAFYEEKDVLSCSPVSHAPLCFHLPVAAYTSRLNPRIRAQSGQFVIYSPHTPPIVRENTGKKGQTSNNELSGCFDYIALDEIQRQWLASHPEEKPFLLKLKIDQPIKEQLGRQLRILGIKTSNYYPELANERFSIAKWL